MRPTRRRYESPWAALDGFIARKQEPRLSNSWLYKFSLMQRELVSWTHGRGLTYIDEFNGDELGRLSCNGARSVRLKFSRCQAANFVTHS